MSLALIEFLLRAGRFGWLLYALGLVGYAVLMVASYPWVRNSPEVETLFESYPRELLALFGLTGKYELTTLPGFLASQYFTFVWVVILAGFTIATASASAAGEIERDTMALLLASPLPRWRLLGSRIVAFAPQVAGLVTATLVGLWLPGPLIDTPIGLSLLLPVGVFGLAFFFALGGYATLLSAVLSDRSRAAMLAVGLTLTFQLLSVLGGLSPEVGSLRSLTIFSLYDPQAAVAAEAVPWREVLGLLALGAGAHALAVFVFAHRDYAVG